MNRRVSNRLMSRSVQRRLTAWEPLEERRVLAAITGIEMEFIYDLNFARHDPEAYDDVIGEPGMLDGVAPKPPLAVNDHLMDSTDYKSADMADENYFAHMSPSGEWPNAVVRDSGYDLNSSFPDNNNYLESIAAGTFVDDPAEVLSMFVIDEGHATPGHRYHLLATGPSESFWSDHVEVGVGHAVNGASTYTNYWSVHTGYRNDTSLRYLTGVVYDDVNSNSRYDAGEGLAGVSVDVEGTTVTTNAAGGWSLSVADGEYDISVSGAGYEGVSSTVATVSGENVGVDFIQGESHGYVNYVPVVGAVLELELDDLLAYDPETGTWVGAVTSAEGVEVSQFGQWGSTHTELHAGDWDGDGDVDVASLTSSGRWYVGWNNGAGSLVVDPAWSWSASISRHDLHVGDFDGDGADDIVHRDGTGRWYVAQHAGGSYTTTEWTKWGPNNGWHGTVVDDFNGDGRDDIASRASWGRWYVAVSDGTSFSTSSWTKWSTSIARQHIDTGDFNGDGMADLVHQTENGSWYVSLSNGSAFTTAYFGRWSPSIERLDFQVGDVNGDGRDDIVSRTTSGNWYVGESSGTSFVTDAYGKWAGGWQFARLGDFDGDGDLDMAGVSEDGSYRVGLSDGDRFVDAFWAAWGGDDSFLHAFVGKL